MPDNMVNIYEPRMMVQALRQVASPRRFLHSTFFPNTVTHTTKAVELDIFKGKRRVAAYVNPILEGRVVERQGYETVEVKPAYTKEKIPTRVADTQSRSFGENIYQAKSPQQRAAELLGQDIAALDERILRLEEKMCAEALFTGKVVVKGDGWDSLVDFGYVAGTNIKTLSGTSCWDNGGDPMKDIDTWRREIVQRCGVQPTHCIIGSKVGWAIIDNPIVKERLDLRRYEMGTINPASLPDGVSYYGDLRLPSGLVSLYSYDEWYTDPVTGDDVALVPEDAVLLASTNARSAFHYGMIQNINSLDAMPRFPLSWVEQDGSARWVQLESAPMPNLYQIDAYTVAHVLQ